MATTKKKKQTEKTAEKQPSTYHEPKRLSKAGQWLLDHPNGIGVIIDRRAVNR